MNTDILILGANGQMGRALVALLGTRAIATTRAELDLAAGDFAARFANMLDAKHPAAVINAAAYTQVDNAEGEGKELALRVNAEAVGIIARECATRNVPLVHYSTDYVFSGSDDAPWKESDPAAPINIYGVSKYAGEQAIIAAGGPHLILRTSWVYDAIGKNFFTTMRRLMHEKDVINVVDDQIGAPTYAPHLAEATIMALSFFLPPACKGIDDGFVIPSGAQAQSRDLALGSKQDPSATLGMTHKLLSQPTSALSGEGKLWGTYHLCHAGETSWFGFAQAIYNDEKKTNPDLKCQVINPIPSSTYPTPARRPLNSRLDCSRAKNVFGISMPDWQEGLRECFATLIERK